MYPIEKYRFYTTKTTNGGHKVIAVSRYAGKTVRGVAICHAEDNFDLEVGKKIAAARCAIKVAEKRKKRAKEKVLEAGRAIKEADVKYEKMCIYYIDAVKEHDKAKTVLEGLLTER